MKIILAEEDKDSRVSLADFLEDLGHEVIQCKDGLEAWKMSNSHEFKLVLTDIKMPGMTGVELLHHLKTLKHNRDFEVIIFTGRGDMQAAIDALRAGAKDYLLKPINIKDLVAIIDRVEASLNLRKVQGNFSEDLSKEVTKEPSNFSQEDVKKAVTRVIGLGEIGFYSDKTRKLFFQALKLHKDRDITVLIQGETGTGKEVFARLIHHGGSDSESPFVDINCAALTPTLFESELFGYEAGAYTGALQKGSKGKIDLAAGGTLFLDEIGEMSIDLQAKLLRVIEEREFYRVGGLKKVKADVRIICATNVNLEEKVQEGLFRPDLFYRLNVGNIKIPPLRERIDEVVPLAEMLLTQLSQKKGKAFKNVAEESATLLKSHSWPGNVRELRNLMEWVVFNYDEELLMPEHMSKLVNPVSYRRRSSTQDILDPKNFNLPCHKFILEDHINEIVVRALAMNDGNKAQTARYLGISRRSLYSLLDRIHRQV